MLTANELLDAELAAQRRGHRDRILERLLLDVKGRESEMAQLRDDLQEELERDSVDCPMCAQYLRMLREVGFDV